jgi:hypothetical protein
MASSFQSAREWGDTWSEDNMPDLISFRTGRPAGRDHAHSSKTPALTPTSDGRSISRGWRDMEEEEGDEPTPPSRPVDPPKSRYFDFGSSSDEDESLPDLVSYRAGLAVVAREREVNDSTDLLASFRAKYDGQQPARSPRRAPRPIHPSIAWEIPSNMPTEGDGDSFWPKWIIRSLPEALAPTLPAMMVDDMESRRGELELEEGMTTPPIEPPKPPASKAKARRSTTDGARIRTRRMIATELDLESTMNSLSLSEEKEEEGEQSSTTDGPKSSTTDGPPRTRRSQPKLASGGPLRPKSRPRSRGL